MPRRATVERRRAGSIHDERHLLGSFSTKHAGEQCLCRLANRDGTVYGGWKKLAPDSHELNSSFGDSYVSDSCALVWRPIWFLVEVAPQLQPVVGVARSLS